MRLRRPLIMLAAAVVTLAVTAVPSQATFAKLYTLNIAPTTPVVTGADDQLFTATYVGKSLYTLGSSNLTAPAGITDIKFVSTTRGTGSVPGSGPTIQLRSMNLGLNVVAKVTFTADVNVPCGETTRQLSWTVLSQSSPTFTGTNNFNTTTPTSLKTNVTPTHCAIADPKTVSTDEGTQATITLSGSDVETCDVVFAIVPGSGPSHGSLGSITNADCTSGTPNTDKATVVYTPTSGYVGDDSFTYTVGDSAPATVTIHVTHMNQGPVNSVPAETQSAVLGTPFVFSSADSNLISISDPDAGGADVKTTLTATNGTVTLSGTSNLIVTGDGTSDVTIQGTIASINAALAGLTYDATAGGSGSLTIETDDLGNTGTGGPKTDTDTVTIDTFETSIPCGEAATLINGENTVTITNPDTGSDCDPVILTANFTGDHLTIDKNGTVAIVVTVDAWDPEPAGSTTSIDPTQTDPAGDDNNADGTWCNGIYDAGSPTLGATMPTGESWCLIDQHAQIAGTHLIQVNEIWLLEGDAALCRTCK